MDVNVEKFFPVSVDDFFDNPDIIVRYAKSLPKKSDPEGRWPGKRTELLWKINKQLNDLILLKILKGRAEEVILLQNQNIKKSKNFFLFALIIFLIILTES